MQYQYYQSELKPFNIRVIEGSTHAVYDLPAPKQWTFKQLIGEDYVEIITEQTVTRVRICLATDEFTNEPYAIAIPYDKANREHPLSSAWFWGACSVTAVLSRMGFELTLPNN